MKKYKLGVILIFFILLLLPVAFTNIENGVKSKIDNEMLPDMNSISDIKTLENYLEKRIGFRSSFINLYTAANDKLFNKMVHPIYDYGKDGQVYFKFSTEEIDTSYWNSYARLIKNMQDYVTQRGSYFVYVLNPTKKQIQNDYLPEGYIYNNVKVEYLRKKFDELNINYIDNEEYLSKKNNKIPIFNKEYDVGHWNDYGAYYGINNIFNKIEKDNNNFKNKLDINNYEISYNIEKTLLVSKFSIRDKVPKFTLKKSNYKKYNISNNIIQSKIHSYGLKTINENGNLNLLMFRGSYFNDKEKYISPYFKTIYYIHNYENAISFDYYYNLSNHPDIVMFTGVEYSITNDYYEKEKIDNKKYNPLYYDLNSNMYDKEKINRIKKFKYIKNIEYDIDKYFSNIVFETNNIDYIYLLLNGEVYDFTRSIEDPNKFILSLEKNLLLNSNSEIVFVNEKNKKMYICDFKLIENIDL